MTEKKSQGAVLHTLSADERKSRAAALKTAQEQQAVRRQQAAVEAEARAKRDAAEKANLEAARGVEAEAERNRTAEAEAKKKTAAEARAEAEQASTKQLEKSVERAAKEAAKRDAKIQEEFAGEDNPLAKLGGRLKTKKSFEDVKQGQTNTKDAPRRRTGKLTIANALDDDERQRSLASVKRAREREKRARASRGGSKSVAREVTIPETITVQDLAGRMAMRAVDLVKELMKQGQMVTANEILDADTAELIVEDLGHIVKRVADSDVLEGLGGDNDDPATLKPRPPVVTIMGHVDHGKTSLLDALRQTDVVAGEAGGITQHIGAYQVARKGEPTITFLDTPGHAAFTQMRSRGAEVTDIVIIVVAADDSVKPQTEEAISHAKASGVPIIIAINKIDKQGADANRVRTDLLQYELQVESMGGEIQDVEVSATEKIGLDKLMEAITLQAELLELTANPDRAAQGAVVESKLDKGRGPVATFLVQRGTIKRGDIVVCGARWGKVRALVDDKGMQIKEGLPSMPVEMLGLNGVPQPGDQFVVVTSEARAREVAEYRERTNREKEVAKSSGTSLELMMAQLQDAEIKELPIVLKGDVQGSVEAIVSSLEKMSTEEVRVRVLHTGVGAITESDVVLAEASGAPVLGFNVRANKQAREESEKQKVEIRYYSVIYDLLDDLKAALSGMLTPELREKFLGNAEILEVFS
ncbi:MAG: translation initiation factor IF-2, partial [Parvularculaceae bacterium]